MKINPILFLLLLFLIQGCENKRIIAFESINNSEVDVPSCNTFSCPEVTVDYVKATGDFEIDQKINHIITNYIIYTLYIGDDEKKPNATTVIEAIEDFIKMYRTHSAEFPDMSAEYFAEVAVSDRYVSEELISLEFRNYLFTGGAHGYGSVEFINLNPTTGDSIASEALFTNPKEFVSIAEQKFRVEQNIPNGASINSTGFWFENDTFSIPASIGITENSLILRYNQYEINSYAAGPIELEISKNEVHHLLTFK